MLTMQTQIPTHARGKVRAFIKAQPGFEAWLVSKGIYTSRNVLNSHLIEYACHAGLDDQVEAIIAGGHSLLVNISSQTIADNQAEDDEIEASIVGRLPSKPVVTQEAGPASQTDVQSILAPVEAFLSPLVRSELEKALAPLVTAANKPAVTIEKIVEKVVNLTPVPVGTLPYATQGNKVTLGSVFGFRGAMSKNLVTLWDSHGAAPAVDPFYVVNGPDMAMMATAIERGSNVWLGGPSGSGKSTMPEQFAAHVGRPCVTFSFDKQIEVADLIGGPGVLTDGSTAWQDGALIQAVKRPGTVIVLDELTGAGPGVHFLFHRLASEARCYTLPTGEVVHCAPGVVFVTADNTFGFGDETGMYHGTHAANQALVNRFARVMRIDYMSKDAEAKALSNHCLGAPKPACDALVEFVGRARKMPEMENVVLSLRQMVGFVQACQDGSSVKQAASVAFLNRLPSAERAALETLFSLTWNQEFSNLMAGSPTDQNPPSQTGPQSPAAKAFDDETSASYIRS